MLDPMVVAQERSSADPASLPVDRLSLDYQSLSDAPELTIDDVLRDDAAFSLFRRTSSLISNPTSQGVSLRGIGPSGASRSLVLLDGVPLNDPFGGWVQWTQVPSLILRKVDIDHGGGSGAWGNEALAGTIQLTTQPFASGHGAIEGSAGGFGERSGEAAASVGLGQAEITADVSAAAIDGFYDLLPQDRGLVDRPMSSKHEAADVQLEEAFSDTVHAEAGVRLFEEDRNNGTALQQNGTRSAIATAGLSGSEGGNFGWTVNGYAEDQGYHGFFSAVAADRTSETPSNNQFAVPASAAGGSVTGSWVRSGAASTIFGADYRHVTGETREDFTYSAGAFTRVRFAGGTQDFAGVFAEDSESLAPWLSATAHLRIDHWENSQGHDREYSLQTGAPTLLSTYPTQTGNELSPDVGLRFAASKSWDLRAAASQAFRLPTLNEYYRPYRVGTVTTEANPNLVAEKLTGGELGGDLHLGGLTASATAFADQVEHAVGNVTISQSASGTTVQRQNLDLVRVRGLEASLTGKPAPWLTLQASYLLDSAIVAEASAQPQLQGLRLPEVPRQTLVLGGRVGLPHDLSLEGRVRWVSLQFDDDANTLRLPAASVVDLELLEKVSPHLSVSLAATNLLDARVETSLSTAGLATYDAPFLLRAGLRVDW